MEIEKSLVCAHVTLEQNRHTSIFEWFRIHAFSRSSLWLCFILSRVFILSYMSGHGSDIFVIADYENRMAHGRIVFKDFASEYPPLVLWLFYLPKFFSNSDLFYPWAFRGMCAFFDLLTWCFLMRINRCSLRRNAVYLICTTCLGPLLFDRMDTIFALFTVGTVYYAGKDKALRSQILAGLGIAFKIIPVVWILVLMASAWRRGAKFVPLAMVLILAPILVTVAIGKSFGATRFDELLKFHSERGTQLESIPASIETLLKAGGATMTETFDHHSFNVHTKYEKLIIAVSTVLLAAVVGASGLVALRWIISPAGIQVLLVAVLSTSIVLSKVFSPQYLLFLLPLLVTVPQFRSKTSAALWSCLVIFIYAATGVIFPWYYQHVCDLLMPWLLFVAVRNLAMIALSCWLFVIAFQVERAPKVSVAGNA